MRRVKLSVFPTLDDYVTHELSNQNMPATAYSHWKVLEAMRSASQYTLDYYQNYSPIVEVYDLDTDIIIFTSPKQLLLGIYKAIKATYQDEGEGSTSSATKARKLLESAGVTYPMYRGSLVPEDAEELIRIHTIMTTVLALRG